MVGALVDDVDADLPQVLVERSVELLEAAGAGIVLADQRQTLRVVASTSERERMLELFQMQHQEGPSLDCYRDGAPVHEASLTERSRWPRFAAEARAAGFRSVHTLPMRWRAQVIGTLDLFRTQLGPLSDDDVMAAQALAEVATNGILQQQAMREARLLGAQLQRALNTRVIIEQAKGLVAGRAGVSIEEALVLLRAYARRHNRRLQAIAELVLAGSLTLQDLATQERPDAAP
ncbi:MAG: GAF and ANTAR domain-containing protein [Acidimicrobiales bacterium]